MIKTETSQRFLQFKEKRQYPPEIQTPVPLLYDSYMHGYACGRWRPKAEVKNHPPLFYLSHPQSLSIKPRVCLHS